MYNTPDKYFYKAQTQEEFFSENGINPINFPNTEGAIKYFTATCDMSIMGMPIKKGDILISVFNGHYYPITQQDFANWITPSTDKETRAVEPVKGRVINSNSDEFDQYVETNKIPTFYAHSIPTPREVFEAREAIKIVTNEGAVFDVEGGDFVIKDLESGNVFKNKADYFNSHYKRVTKETN